MLPADNRGENLDDLECGDDFLDKHQRNTTHERNN